MTCRDRFVRWLLSPLSIVMAFALMAAAVLAVMLASSAPGAPTPIVGFEANSVGTYARSDVWINADGPYPAVGLYWYDSTDPTVGPGMAAPLKQLLIRTDTPSIYYKSGEGNTQWTLIGSSTGGGGGVTSITCSTGLTCTPNPITGAGSVALTNTAVTPGTYTYATLTVNAQGQLTAASSGTAPVTGTGATGDLMSWASSSSAGNYAGSSPSACTAGNVTTGVTLSAAGALTNTCTAIGTAGGVTGTGTSPDIAIWSSSSGITNYAGSTGTACGAGNVTTNVAVSAAGALTNTCTAIGAAGGVTGTGTSPDLAIWSSSSGITNYAGSTAVACPAGQADTQPAISASGALTTTCTAFVPAANVSGTTNTVAKFTSTTAVGNSSATDNGTTYAVGAGGWAVTEATGDQLVPQAARTSPATGASVGISSWGGDTWSTQDTSGLTRYMQNSIGHAGFILWRGGFNAATPTTINVGIGATVGTATTRSQATTNFCTQSHRIGYVSAATANSVSGIRDGLGPWRGNSTGLGGFLVVLRFCVSDAVAVTTSPTFVGLETSAAAPTAVDPTTLTNIAGVCADAADTNLAMCFCGASSCSEVTLGASFPANTASTATYELALYAAPNASSISWQVNRLDPGSTAQASGTMSTAANLLSNSTLPLEMQTWRANGNGTTSTASAVGIDLISYYDEEPY